MQRVLVEPHPDFGRKLDVCLAPLGQSWDYEPVPALIGAMQKHYFLEEVWWDPLTRPRNRCALDVQGTQFTLTVLRGRGVGLRPTCLLIDLTAGTPGMPKDRQSVLLTLKAAGAPDA